MPVEPRLFSLLQLAKRMHNETSGAFDITVGPLIRCWGFMGGSGALPSPEDLAEARARVGMHHVVLDEKRFTIRFAREGMMIDLGSIGKGYALEVAAETLLEAGVTCALLHGGTSTICGIGAPPEAEGWKIAIDAPPGAGEDECDREVGTSKRPLAVVELRDEALSVSGIHGKCFAAGGKTYGHVIDPRTGSPTEGAVLSAVVLASATETDALSTALLVTGRLGQEKLIHARPTLRALVAERTGQGDRLTLRTDGIDLLPAKGTSAGVGR